MEFAGKSVLLRVFWDRVELTDQGRMVAMHERVTRGRVSMQLTHYLPVLERKPRAVTHAAVISQGPPAIARYRDEFLVLSLALVATGDRSGYEGMVTPPARGVLSL